MARDIGRLDTQRALTMFADWTDRIAAGELPFAKPQRPQGVERNVVVTLWDWGRPLAKPTPRNVSLGSDRFAMFNKERDIPGGRVRSRE